MPDFLKPHDNLLPSREEDDKKETPHDASSHSSSDMEAMLHAIAKEPSEPIRDATKQVQRAEMIALAEKHMPKKEQTKQKNNSREGVGFQISPYLVWLRWSAGVAALAVVLVVGASYFLKWQNAGTIPGRGNGSVLALTIPAAHASDAFVVEADRSDAGGIDPETTWTITTNVPVTKDALQSAITISPETPLTFEEKGGNAYQISSTQPLEGGKIYTIKLAAAIQDPERGDVGREFSWAFQTKDVFRVLSSIPADASGNVPVDTGIEFKFTRTDFENPDASFSINPPVSGSFEHRGRYLTFIPEKPLDPGRRYEIVLKKGFGVKDSDLALAEDVRIEFETALPDTAAESRRPLPLEEFLDARPNERIPVRLSGGAPSDVLGKTVEVKGFALSREEAFSLMTERLAIPDWAYVEHARFSAYEQKATKEAFTMEATLERQDYTDTLTIPAIETPGYYAVRITAAGHDSSWMLLQVTNLAYYLTSDENQMLVWAVNAETNRPLGNLPIKFKTDEARTDSDGTGTVPTPKFLSGRDQPTGQDYGVLEVGEGDLSALIPVKRWGIYYGVFRGDFIYRGNQKVWSYLYTDRPLYRTTDEVHFFGLAQDRELQTGVGALKARVVAGNYLFYGDDVPGEQKVYAETSLQTDAAGRFEGSLPLDHLAPDEYYTLEIRDGDSLIASKGFNVREISKPSFFIDVSTDQDRVFGGETVHGQVKAQFYNGAPLVRTQLDISSSQDNVKQKFTVTTDEFGVANFNIPSEAIVCPAFADGSTYCASEQSLVIGVRPVEGEEGEVHGEAYVQVFAGAVGLNVRALQENQRASVTIEGYHKRLDSDSSRGEVWPGRSVEGRVYARYWERSEVGQRYDFVLKRVVPIYRYELRYDPPQTFRVTTDAQGKASYGFDVDPSKDYEVVVQARDDAGRVTQENAWVYTKYRHYGGTPAPSLTFDNADGERPEYALDAPVAATLRLENDPIPSENTPGTLFLLASRGIVRHQVENTSQYHFNYDERLMPNVEVIGVTFANGAFIEADNTAFFKKENRALQVQMDANQEAYAPGEEVEVRLRVTQKESGMPAGNTVVAYGAVDEALLSLGYNYPATPLQEIYEYVDSGIVFKLHSAESLVQAAGAEGGGGGLGDFLESARRNFKDTAAFGTVATDADGSATIRFTVPDNLTSWRLEGVAITDNLYAGSGQISIPVTKPIFVDAVLADRLLASDKAVIKLRAFGKGLPQTGAMTFRIHAPTLGLNDEAVQASVGQSVYIEPKSLPIGKHKLVVGVEVNGEEDAIEREIDVAPTRFLHDEYVSVEAAPGATLPSTEGAQTTVMFLAQNQASLLPVIQSALYRSLPRTDAQIARVALTRILRESFGRTDLPENPEISLSDYQDYSGGMRLLPYASPDLELSAEVAQTAPELVDREALASYLWQNLDNKKAEKSEQIVAISGLAALGEPVLPELKRLAGDESLDWREVLWIARGLEAAGDREDALKLLNNLLESAVLQDGLMSVGVSEDPREITEATADAAALAAAVGHEKAFALMKYVQEHANDEAFPVLAKVRYVKAILPTLLKRDISLTYAVSSSESETLTFRQEAVITRTLTREEASHFLVTRVDGPVDIVFVREVSGRPEASDALSISRRYEGGANGAYKEGDLVRVHLNLAWKQTAEDGCYVVRDHLPGGWAAVLNWNNFDTTDWYPTQIENGEVTFYACKQSRPVEISYLARVVARGTYTAEAALLQNMQSPSVAALGSDEQVHIDE